MLVRSGGMMALISPRVMTLSETSNPESIRSLAAARRSFSMVSSNEIGLKSIRERSAWI